MFTIALFEKAKTREGVKCPLIGDWVSRLCYIHSMECKVGISNIETGQHVQMEKNCQDKEFIF